MKSIERRARENARAPRHRHAAAGAAGTSCRTGPSSGPFIATLGRARSASPSRGRSLEPLGRALLGVRRHVHHARPRPARAVVPAARDEARRRDPDRDHPVHPGDRRHALDRAAARDRAGGRLRRRRCRRCYADLQQQQWFQDASSGSGGVLSTDLQLDHRRSSATRPSGRPSAAARSTSASRSSAASRRGFFIFILTIYFTATLDSSKARDLHADLRVAPRAGRRLRRAHHAERRPLPQRHGGPRVLQRDLQPHRPGHRAGAVRARDRGRRRSSSRSSR